ncbi:MAG: tRNA lysidine(34) synthetase TilS [Dehalococcoidia bacterium]|nr:tRNA lysidine(34) synthetase TilS [Dehalococcoidia bacterium]
MTGSKILAAVSGGPDSLALVHALAQLRDTLGIRLYAAHLDHGLRPTESAADAEFVSEAMDELRVPLFSEKSDVSRFRRENRLSVEDAARQVRYKFLARVSEQVDADAVAVGHNLDDQAETVLMHLIRGSGLAGLRAMTPVYTRSIDGVPFTVFRPLLKVPKADMVAYCSENGLSPRLDESNLSEDMTRNRIRLDLLPHMRSYNPAISVSLGRLAESVSHDIDFIAQAVDRATSDVLTRGPSGVTLDRSEFGDLHPAMQRHLLRRAVESVAGNASDLEFAHIEEMTRLMAGPAGKKTRLPGLVTLEVDHDWAYLSAELEQANLLPEVDQYPTKLNVPGDMASGGWTASAQIVDGAEIVSNPPDRIGLKLVERFDADALGHELLVRTRRPGDVFRPLGMNSEKSLSDFMKDAHVPARWRDRLPIITNASGEVAWIVGWRIADWAKITDDTRRVVEIRCTYDNARPAASEIAGLS